jgi:hypothetical protein
LTSGPAHSTKTTQRRHQLAECFHCPTHCLPNLTPAKARQAAERLSLGEAHAGLNYVVCNEAGEPYHPSTLSTMWPGAIKSLDVPRVRLHDARHTCATLMHLHGVPIALVAAWLGHAECHSPFGPTCMRNLRLSNWRRAALLRRHQAPAIDALAHACGDINQSLVTSCDNFRRRRTYVHSKELERHSLDRL